MLDECRAASRAVQALFGTPTSDAHCAAGVQCRQGSDRSSSGSLALSPMLASLTATGQPLCLARASGPTFGGMIDSPAGGAVEEGEGVRAAGSEARGRQQMGALSGSRRVEAIACQVGRMGDGWVTGE